MRILNTEFKVMCNDKMAIPESALKMQLQAEHKKNSFKETRFGKQWSNLGEALKARRELDSVSLPASVLEAPYECPDVSASNLSYNDTKAVTKEIFLWVLKKFNTVYTDKTFALHVEKLLLAAGIKHYKGERWWKVIVDRFENGRRSHAKVYLRLRIERARPNAFASSLTARLAHHPLPQHVYKNVEIDTIELTEESRELIGAGLHT